LLHQLQRDAGVALVEGVGQGADGSAAEQVQALAVVGQRVVLEQLEDRAEPRVLQPTVDVAAGDAGVFGGVGGMVAVLLLLGEMDKLGALGAKRARFCMFLAISADR
jgi:hypothetical protein